MKPPPFEYAAPESLDEALVLLARAGEEAKLLAGGQSLIPLLNFRLAQPSLLIDLNRVPGLDHIAVTAEGGLSLGAMVRQRRLEREAEIARRAPLLAEAAPWIAHPQIRNRGTLGGSLSHADPAAELPALAVALQARFELTSAAGRRTLPARDFFTGLLATALRPDEILTAVEIPPLPPHTGTAFLEVARRHGDYAQAGVAALVALNRDGTCSRARWVYLALGAGPVEAEEAAAALTGEHLSPERLREAALFAAAHEIDPSGDLHGSAAFKRHLAGVVARRALETAHHRALALLTAEAG